MDTESVVDSDTNIVNPEQADKGVGDTAFALFGAVKKRVGDANKDPWGVGKRVGDKVMHFLAEMYNQTKHLSVILLTFFPSISSLIFHFLQLDKFAAQKRKDEAIVNLPSSVFSSILSPF